MPETQPQRPARAARLAAVGDWLEELARHQRRWVLGTVVGGGALVSMLVGMTLGGAFAGVDVALPPTGTAPAAPRIEYAAPSKPRAHSDAHPATSASGSHGATQHDTTTTTPVAAGTGTPIAAPGSSTSGGASTSTSGSGSSSGSTSGSGGSATPSTTVPTTAPTAPTTTPTTTVPSGGGGGGSSGPLSGVKKIIG